MSYRNFFKDFNFLSHTFHPHIKIAILLYLFHSESKHFDSSPSSICRVSVNGFSSAPAESAVFQLRNIWSGKIMDRSFGTLVRSWGFFQFTHTQSLLSPKNQRWTYVCMQKFFWVSTLYRVDETEELEENFEKEAPSLFMRASRKYRKLWILHYCPKEFCPGL